MNKKLFFVLSLMFFSLFAIDAFAMKKGGGKKGPKKKARVIKRRAKKGTQPKRGNKLGGNAGVNRLLGNMPTMEQVYAASNAQSFTNSLQNAKSRRGNKQNLQIDDAFVRGFVDAGIVDKKGFAKLPDGSYVMQIKSVSQGGLGKGVCPAMGLRSAQLMLNYLYVLNEFQKDDKSYLAKISNKKDAQVFLRDLKAKVGEIGNLTQDQIEAILQKSALETLDAYNKINKILCPASEKNLIVVDSVKIETEKTDFAHPQVENLIMAKTTVQSALDSGLDCFYRAFVVGTGKISGGHWVGASVTKRNGILYWFVCDSSKSATNIVQLGKILAQRMIS